MIRGLAGCSVAFGADARPIITDKHGYRRGQSPTPARRADEMGPRSYMRQLQSYRTIVSVKRQRNGHAKPQDLSIDQESTACAGTHPLGVRIQSEGVVGVTGDR
jgi:hypothetical protein